MQIAARMRQVRLEYALSLEDLAARAGLSRSLLANFENGQDVPQLETFDRVAEALGVPLHSLFYASTDSNFTPRLAPRLTLQQLMDGPRRSTLAVTASLLNFRLLSAAARMLRSSITGGDRRGMGTAPEASIPSSNISKPAEADPSGDVEGSEPKS